MKGKSNKALIDAYRATIETEAIHYGGVRSFFRAIAPTLQTSWESLCGGYYKGCVSEARFQAVVRAIASNPPPKSLERAKRSTPRRDEFIALINAARPYYNSQIEMLKDLEEFTGIRTTSLGRAIRGSYISAEFLAAVKAAAGNLRKHKVMSVSEVRSGEYVRIMDSLTSKYGSRYEAARKLSAKTGFKLKSLHASYYTRVSAQRLEAVKAAAEELMPLLKKELTNIAI